MADDAHGRIAELRMEINRLTREQDDRNERMWEMAAELGTAVDRAETAEWMVEMLREALAFYAQLSTYQTRTVSTSGERARAETAEQKVEKLRAAIHSAYVEGWTDATSRDDPKEPGVIDQEWEASLARATLNETEK